MTLYLIWGILWGEGRLSLMTDTLEISDISEESEIDELDSAELLDTSELSLLDKRRISMALAREARASGQTGAGDPIARLRRKALREALNGKGAPAIAAMRLYLELDARNKVSDSDIGTELRHFIGELSLAHPIPPELLPATETAIERTPAVRLATSERQICYQETESPKRAYGKAARRKGGPTPRPGRPKR